MKKKIDIKLFPIVFTWGLIPLIVQMKTYNTGYSQYDWYSEAADVQNDFFLMCKSYFIIAIAVIMLCMISYQMFTQKKKQVKLEPAIYCLLVYAGFAFASFAFSQYKYYASHGAYELFESVWVVLGYMIICYYTYMTVNREEQVFHLVKISSLFFAIMAAIGVSQFLNCDFFKTEIGKKLITPTSFWSNLDQISFTFDPGTVYATLYNPDWVGFYAGIVLPILLVMGYRTKKVWTKCVYGILAIGIFICLIGARAMGGIIAFMSAVAISILILLCRNKKGMIAAGGAIVVGTVVLIGFLQCTTLGQNVVVTFKGTNKGYENFGVKRIETNDEDVVFGLEDRELHITYQVDGGRVWVQCQDGDGNGILLATEGENGNIFVVADESYLGCTITPIYIEDDIAIEVNIDQKVWRFCNQQDGTYYYYNPIGKYVKFPEIKDAGIFNNDGFQNRGVIWNHTIPLLKNYMIFGNGANTFAQAYPQDDYIYKEYMGMQYMYDVKAHNWYLQQWVEEGFIALVAFIVFYMIYFLQCVKLYRKNNLKDPIVAMGMALFTGVTAYMVGAIVNDSNVTTAPVFWVTIGLGYAVNRMIREKMQN